MAALQTGVVIREVKVATKPAEILAVLAEILAVLIEQALAIERIGREAGPLSQWLYGALAEGRVAAASSAPQLKREWSLLAIVGGANRSYHHISNTWLTHGLLRSR